jgi:hypothetical protein
MSGREHKRGHQGSKMRREEYALRKNKSPTRGHIRREEKPFRA